MEDKIKAALDPDVTVREFFFEHLKGIHEQRKDTWARVSMVPVIVSVLFEDTGERYTFELSSTGYRVEQGDMVDFPIATLVASEAEFRAVREDLLEAALALYTSEEKLERQYGKKPLTAQDLEDFESMTGTIEVHVTGASAPLSFKIYLNDYESDGGSNHFSVTLERDLLMGLARGEVGPKEFGGKVKVSGKMAFALALGGFLQRRLGG